MSLALLLAACGGDGPTGPVDREPSVRAILGAGVTDTIEAQPLQALIIQVKGQGGVTGSGAIVRVEAQPPDDSTRRYEPAIYVCEITAPTCGPYSGYGYGFGSQLVIDTTDAQGRVKVTVRLGQVAGRAVVRLIVPELGLGDSATFTVKPGAAADVRAQSSDTALDIGGTATLRGHVVDRYNNIRPEAPTVSAGPGSAFTLDAATGVVTGRDMGTQQLFTRYNAFSAVTTVRVLPAGRLVVWSSDERAVRLVNVNGTDERTLVTSVSSDLGAFPHFDPSRRHVTLHGGSEFYGGPPNNIIVIDTTTSPRRDIGPASGFSIIMATRELEDGAVLVVAQRTADSSHPGYSLWRLATDNTVTFVAALPELQTTYGGADISHSGTRVAYIANTPFNTELRVLDVSDGSSAFLEAGARSPRWSAQDDRVAYLVPVSGSYEYDGVVTIRNPDGTGGRTLGTATFSPGLGWSPDGKYIIGRSNQTIGLRLLRVSDGADVLVRFPTATGCCHDYWQPDWR